MSESGESGFDDAELTAEDVAAFTGGRLAADNPQTQDMLDAALAVARKYCGWHVSPVRLDDEFTLDGKGGTQLFPPTRRILDLVEATSDGVDVTANCVVPAQAQWKIVLSTGVWSTAYNGITVQMDHGYHAAEASDWRYAILTMVDQMSSTSGRPDSALVQKQVDTVVYQWAAAAEEALWSVKSVLERYEILPVLLA